MHAATDAIASKRFHFLSALRSICTTTATCEQSNGIRTIADRWYEMGNRIERLFALNGCFMELLTLVNMREHMCSYAHVCFLWGRDTEEIAFCV